MATTQNQFSQSDILKAQFCRQYFIELKQFLSKFDISDREDGTYSNDLDMHSLMEDSLNAYTYKPKNSESELTKQQIIDKTQRYRDERRFNMHWNIGSINEKDLMLAIEQYFDITQKENYSEQMIDLQEKRNTLISYLLDPSNDRAIEFEDYSLHAILRRFNVLSNDVVEPIGNQVQEFNHFTDVASNHLKRFKWALVLLKELRNWKGHQGSLPYMIEQLKLFHKFILFTYIGLVYVCRNIWADNQCLIRIGDRGREIRYNRPGEALDFNIPAEKVNIVIKNFEKKKFTCYYCLNREDEGDKLEPIRQNDEELCYELSHQKYVPFYLKIFTEGDGEPFVTPKELNYYSWFLTLEINVPKVLVYYEGIAGNNTQIENLVSDIASEIDKSIDIKIKENLQAGLVQLQPYLYQIQQIEKDSKKFETLQNTIIESLGILKKMSEAQNKSIVDIQRNFSTLLDDYKTAEEAKRKSEQFDFYLLHLLWLVPMGFVIFIYFLLDKWDRNLIWLELKSNYYWIIPIFLVFPLIIYRLGYLRAHGLLKRPWVKRTDILIGLFLLLSIAIFPFTVPYKRTDSYISNYNLSIHNRSYNEKAVEFTEKYLSKNSKSEDAMIMLATYYLNYTNNIKEALRVTEPMRNVWDYKEGAFYAAEALYKQGDFAAVRDIFHDFQEAHKNSVTPGLLYLRGIMQYAGGRGYEKNIDSCRQNFLFAIYTGEIAKKYGGYGDYREATIVAEAAYELGHLLSHDTSGFLDDSLFVNTSLISYAYSYKYKNQIVNDTLYIPAFNLPLAVKYLRKAAPLKPEAALELANIFSDLNINDSALYYYDNVINVTNDYLQLEAIFRKSLVYEKIGATYPNHEEKAKILTYPPARLHRAMNLLNKEDSHKDFRWIINELDSVTQYDGRRYIPIKAFAYIQSGEKKKALDELQKSRKEGNFDMEFVEGMSAMLRKIDYVRDSLGMEHMRRSANNGCLYAKMICLYRDAECGKVKVSDFMNFADIIGDSIPFAYALASRLALLVNSPVWAAKYAAIASGKGHPAGALFMTSIPRGGMDIGEYYLSLLNMDTQPDEAQNSLIHGFRQLFHYCVRLSPNKLVATEAAYLADNYFYRNEKQKQIPLEEVHFWGDVAMANKLTGLELQLMLLAVIQNDENYVRKNLESLMGHINKETVDTLYFEKLSVIALSYLDNNYIDSLRNVYQNDVFKKEILSREYCGNIIRKWNVLYPQMFKDGKLMITVPSVVDMFSFDISDRDLLNELNDFFADDLYNRPLRYE